MHARLRRRRARARLARPRAARACRCAQRVLGRGRRRRSPISTASPTRRGPGLAGALLVGASVASALGFALGKPVIGVHHLEGHLLSPLLAEPAPAFPFVALLVSGGHSQLFDVDGRRALPAARRHAGRRGRRGLRQDGEAARPAVSGRAGARAARRGGARRRGVAAAADARQRRSRLQLLRAQDRGADARARARRAAGTLDDARRADIAREFQDAIVDVLVAKALAALDATGRARLVVAGGVGANRELRARLAARRRARAAARCSFPDLEFCTDNGAMIALVGALRLAQARAATTTRSRCGRAGTSRRCRPC